MGAFIARLDRAWASIATAPATISAELVPQQRPIAQPPRLLVVDDNPSNLDDACDLLGSWGITPILAADGTEAVALACEGQFDLILMDLQMPVLDGLAATMKIRRFERQNARRRVPVLAFTSLTPPMTLLRNCGLDGFLQKPCTTDELQACLRHWCTPQDRPRVAAIADLGGANAGM